MKKLLGLVFLTFFFSASAAAQEFDFQKAYEDYRFQRNQYRTAHQEYLTAKNQYLTYQTLTSKTAALNKTQTLLEKRDQALETYLTALKLKLGEETSVIGYQANMLYLELDKEILFLQNHRSSLTSASTLEDLLGLSSQFEEKYPALEILIYRAIGEILLNKERKLGQQADELITDLGNKIQEIKSENEEESLLWERWLLEAENKTVRANEKQKASQLTLQNFDQKKGLEEQFSQAQILIKESHQYLKEAVFYLAEIIREIKSG